MRSAQALVALVAIIALESVFAAMARLGDLADHIPEFMALALGAGVLYFIALYGLEHTRENRAVLWLVLLGALAKVIELLRNRFDGRIGPLAGVSDSEHGLHQ